METKELLTSLAKLESTLQEVESAKNQVKQTVGAYDGLQKQITEYAHSLDSIKMSIQGILSEINNQRTSLGQEATSLTEALESKCNLLLKMLNNNLSAANETFAKEGKAISDSFKEGTDEQLTKLQQGVQALRDCTSELEGLQTSIKDTLSEISQMRQGIADLKQSLESSQEAQDTVLSEIRSRIGSQTDLLGTLKSAQDDAFKTVDSQFKAGSVMMNSLSKGLYKRQRSYTIITIINLVLLFILIALMLLK